MALMQAKVAKDNMLYKQKVEMADAHCHPDMLTDELLNQLAEIGVSTMVVNGVDTASNINVLGLFGKKGVYPALGMHPESAMKITAKELDYNIELIRINRKNIFGIGEIGLDYTFAKDKEQKDKQSEVFVTMIELAKELDLPVSVHAREAIKDVISTLDKTGIKKAHIHFFEGDVDDAKAITERGFMISVPPLQSSKRSRAIASMPINNIMVESDSPTAGMKPSDIEKAIMIVAKAKGMEFSETAKILTENTKRFFNIGMTNLIRRN